MTILGLRARVAIGGSIVLLSAGSAYAQKPATWEVSGFIGRLGADTSAPTSALLVPNQPGSPAPATPLFTLSISEDRSLVAGGRITQRLTPHAAAEIAVTYGHPTLTAIVSADARGSTPAPFVYAKGREWSVDGSAVFQASPLAGWIQPFVFGGGGLLRQGIDSGGSMHSGGLFRLGGGGKFIASRSSSRTQLGTRVDVFDEVRTRLFDAGTHPRSTLGVTASLFARF
jgi:hypothetical protein